MADTTIAIENKIESAKNTDELKEIIKNLPKVTFCTRIDELRGKYGFESFSPIQKNVAMSKTIFYNIINGTRPAQKHQIIKIGLEMGLMVEEVNELLKLAGHKELYAKNSDDAIIIYGIQNKLAIKQIEELLMDSGSKFTFYDK